MAPPVVIAAGLTVSLEPEGLGGRPEILACFCRHIRSAMDATTTRSGNKMST